MVGTTAGLADAGGSRRPPGRASLDRARDAVEGVGEIVWAGLNPAPETPLNVEIGPHRRYSVVRQQLADYKTVKDTLGGTVNDVILTVVSGAVATWLNGRGIRTEGLELRALVPVSVRTQDQRGTLGNQLAVMRGPLPVYIRDPLARLRFVKTAMDGLKESKQAVGAATLAAVNNLAPPTVLAQASRLNFSTRLFNLIVTNIPGPQLPLYVLGRRLVDLFPVAFLPQEPRARDRDHVLRRPDRVRIARRLRRAAGHRRGRGRGSRTRSPSCSRRRAASRPPRPTERKARSRSRLLARERRPGVDPAAGGREAKARTRRPTCAPSAFAAPGSRGSARQS